MKPVFQELWYNPEFLQKRVIHGLFFSILFLFSMLYKAIFYLRKKFYDIGVFSSYGAKVPVIVVGNLTVGGTGKTPLIIALTKLLKKVGHRPGIVSRGYGGKSATYPLLVTEKTSPKNAGDESVLLAFRTQSPVVISPRRAEAVAYLEEHCDCTIILSDDGLQHFAMKRDIEIIVIDGERRFGNGFCLPAGPLREPLKRYKTVDFVVNNMTANTVLEEKEYPMHVCPESFVSVHSKKTETISFFKRKPAHVVTGIGNPSRFFSVLTALEINFDVRIFNDHHFFVEQDLTFDEKKPIIMTEKDAVKCQYLKSDNDMYYLKVNADLDKFEGVFLKKLEAILERKKNAFIYTG